MKKLNGRKEKSSKFTLLPANVPPPPSKPFIILQALVYNFDLRFNYVCL